MRLCNSPVDDLGIPAKSRGIPVFVTGIHAVELSAFWDFHCVDEGQE